MTKAKREMDESVKIVDLVIELLDARVPMSSRNPDIDTLAANKFRLILLNKADLADPEATSSWISFFSENGITAIPLDSREKTKMKSIQSAIESVCREKFERDRRRGILNRPVRAMVAGIPNVGKSTFINSFSGRAAAKTGNKPGVTKGNQWIRLNKKTELLDTPGILWPKFDDELTGTHLAFIGSVNDDVIDTEELSLELLRFLLENEKEALISRYQIELCGDPYEILSRIAVSRNCIKKGGEADLLRAASLVIDDFRTGKTGRITVERP